MATSQEVDSSSDQITQVCNFCNTNVSDGYCAECEDHMCQSCFDIHTRARNCRHHVLIDDINHPNFNKKTFSEPCTQHPSQMLEFYCVDHKNIGCIRCFFPKHRNCNYENVEDAAKRFKESGEDKRIKKEIERLKNVYTDCTNQSEIDTNNVAEVNRTVVNDINSFTDRVISYAEQFKNDLLGRSERLHRENETCLEKYSNDLVSVGEELENCEIKLNDAARDEKLFIVSVEIAPKIKELEEKMSSFGRLNAVKKYEFQPNKFIMTMLEESKCLGEICIVDERITRKTPGNSFQRETTVFSGLENFSQSATAWIEPVSSAERKLKKELGNVGATINAKTDKQVSNTYIPCIITDVSELVWKIVSIICSQTISDIESKCRQKVFFSAEKYQVCLPATDECMDGRINSLKNELENMKQKEIAEMKLNDEEVEKVDNAFKELESSVGMKCCLSDKQKRSVYIYGDSYDALSRYQKLLRIKIGRKEVTARGKRTKPTIIPTSKDNIQIPNDQTSAVSSLVTKTYVTAEGITVSVYKADILRSNVDCIVNAANSDLRNGGGMALVISKHAGPALDTESKEYIRKHGKLSVASAVAPRLEILSTNVLYILLDQHGTIMGDRIQYIHFLDQIVHLEVRKIVKMICGWLF